MRPQQGDEDGGRPYRMTSTLTLHSAKARGEEPDPSRDFYRDPFDRGVLIASDGTETGGKRKGKKGGRHASVKDRFDELFEPYLVKYYFIKETALYPLHMVGQQMDQVLDGMQQAGTLWQQLVAQGVKEIFRPRSKAPELLPGGAPIAVKPISFVDLYQFNVQFTDNMDVPLYDFERSKRSKYAPSPIVVDPMALEKALVAIKECAERAHGIPPATEGRYAGVPLAHVLYNAGDADLQGFMRYVKAYPGNYVGRNLKISETFATWVVYGAPDP